MKNIILISLLILHSLSSNAQAILSASPLTTQPGDTLDMMITLAAPTASSNFTITDTTFTSFMAWSAYNTTGNDYNVVFYPRDYCVTGDYVLKSPGGSAYSSPVTMNSNNYPEIFEYQSVNQYNAPADKDSKGIRCIETDSQGNIYLAGTFSGSIQIGSQPIVGIDALDGYIVKMNPLGQVIWARIIGGMQDQEIRQIKVYNDSIVYVSGKVYCDSSLSFINVPAGVQSDTLRFPLRNNHSSDGILIKLDSSGNYIWHSIQGSIRTDDSRAFDIDANGNIYLTGHIQGDGHSAHDSCSTFVYAAGNNDSITMPSNYDYNYGLFIASYAPNGSLRWAKAQDQVLLTHGASGYGIKICSDRSLVLLAFTTSFVTYEGFTCSNSCCNNHFLLLKTDSLGHHIWCNDDGNNSPVFNLGIDQSDNVYFAYIFNASSYDTWLDKYSPAGTRLFHQRIHNNPDNSGNFYSTTDMNGNTYVAFRYNHTWASAVYNFEVKKFDSNGSRVALTYPMPFTPADFGPTAITLDKTQQKILVAGYFSGSQTFDTTTITSSTKNTFFNVMNMAQNLTSVSEPTINYPAAVFPNPFNDKISIHKFSPEKCEIIVRDISGKILSKFLQAGTEIIIPTAAWAQGIYLLTIGDSRRIETKRIVKIE